MVDIKIGLSIREEAHGNDPTEFGVAIAGKRTSVDSAEVHVEGYGFEPSKEGAELMLGMLRDLIRSLEVELGGQPGDPAVGPERLDHNMLDSECKEHQKRVDEGFAVQTSGAARCPVCRPVRPRFNPQPIGQPTK